MDNPPNNYRKKNNCPYCNVFVDAALIPDDEKEKPIPGALSVCIHCAKVSIFDDEMKLKVFDMNGLDKDDHAHVVRIQYHIHGSQGKYSKKH